MPARIAVGLIVAFIVGPAVFAASAGTLNAFEGEVRVDWVPVRRVSTGHGMAEILLARGSFLRLGEGGDLTLESGVRIRLENGEALLEVVTLQAPIVPEKNGVSAVVRKPGLYGFDQRHAVMTIYEGEAEFGKGGVKKIASPGFSVGARHHMEHAPLRTVQRRECGRRTGIYWRRR